MKTWGFALRATWNERSGAAALALGLSLGLGAPPLAAAQQTPQAQSPGTKPAEKEPAEKKTPGAKQEPDTSPPRARSKDVFIPTEKVPADAAVSFPVEI